MIKYGVQIPLPTPRGYIVEILHPTKKSVIKGIGALDNGWLHCGCIADGLRTAVLPTGYTIFLKNRQPEEWLEQPDQDIEQVWKR